MKTALRSSTSKSEVKNSVSAVRGLSLISEIVALHNRIWNHSTGIIDLLQNSSCCFVVKRNGSVAGYLFVEEDRNRGFVELQDLAVAPENRGRGIGKALIKTAMKRYPHIKLIARAENPPLIDLYKNLGFREDYRIENYYEVGQDGLRMSWIR